MHLLSRKFIVSLVGIAAAAGLAYLGRLDAPAAGLIGTIVAAYLGSNVTQKAVV